MPPTPTTPNNSKTKIVSIVIVVILIVAFIAMRQRAGVPQDITTLPTPTSSSTEPVVIDTKKYKDGTYNARGNYRSPEGNETVDITLTLKDGIITNATFVGNATDPASKTLQSQFAQGYKAVVIGKPIDTLSLNVVNGSSLTPKGFMDAVNKIKVQAAL